MSPITTKVVGRVAETLTGCASQKQLLVVYVTTILNQTSGFHEIVPASDAAPTGWSVNDAIALIVSGGPIGSPVIDYDRVRAAELSGAYNIGDD